MTQDPGARAIAGSIMNIVIGSGQLRSGSLALFPSRLASFACALLCAAASVACRAPAVLDPAGLRSVRIDAAGAAAHGVAVRSSDGSVFVAAGRDYLVVDATDPSSPRTRAMVPGLFSNDRLLAVEDRRLYACGPGGVAAYDVSDPAAPTLLRELPVTGACRDLVAYRGTVLMAQGELGFVFVDFNAPATDVRPAGYLEGGDAVAVVRVGDYAYGADARRGLAVLRFGPDGRVAEARQVPGVLSNPTAIGGGGGGRPLVFTDANRFGLLSIADPASPALLGPGTGARGLAPPGRGHIVLRAEGQQAFFDQGGIDGIAMMDLSDAAYPSLRGTLAGPGGAGQLAFIDDVTLAVAYAPGGAVLWRYSP